VTAAPAKEIKRASTFLPSDSSGVSDKQDQGQERATREREKDESRDTHRPSCLLVLHHLGISIVIGE